MKHISELREQTNHSRKPKIIMKTKVFYKGMLVTKMVFRDDANLLEYIDIKDISGEPLKLNRDGFSQSGYDFLDGIYFKIVKTARDALKHFGTMSARYEESPMQKIQSNIMELLNTEHIAEASRAIIGCAALTYFAMIDESDEVFGKKRDGKTSFWNKLIQKIYENLSDDTYATIKKQLFETSTLFRMPILVKEDDTYYVKETTILEIVNNENKYMVVSKRDRVNRGWNSYLVVFPGDYEAIKNKVKALRNTNDPSDRKKIIRELEKISNELLDIRLDRNTGNDIKWNVKEQVALKWVLSNIPSLAMISTPDGDTRVNVLDTEICDSVFLNNAMKNLIIDRMVETFEKEGFQRFSSMVWSGYSYLSLNNPRLSVKFIKRGKLARTAYGEMLIPLTGIQMKEMRAEICKGMEESEKTLRKLYVEVYERVLSFINKPGSVLPTQKNRYVNYLIEIQPDETVYEADFLEISDDDYKRLVEGIAEEKTHEIQMTDEQASYEADKSEQRNEKRDAADRVQKEMIAPRMKLFKKKYKDYLDFSMDFDIQTRFCNGEAHQNLLNYVKAYAKLSPSALRAERLVFCLIAEMLDAMVEWKKREFLESLDGEFRSLLDSVEER